MFDVKKVTFKLGEDEIVIETGQIARQASGSVTVQCGDNVIHVAAVIAKDAVEGQSFLPLSVNYQEKAYAAGSIPGGFFKREGRPSEKETLTSRLIDRPLRPLFDHQFKHETNVIVTVLSTDRTSHLEHLAIIGASAALSIAGAPYQGPVAASKVAYIDDNFVLNPKITDAKTNLDLTVAGTQDAVLMVESEADQLSEAIMLEAVMFGHEQMQPAIQAIQALVEQVNPAPFSISVQNNVDDEACLKLIRDEFSDTIAQAYQTTNKVERQSKIAQIYQQINTKYETNEQLKNLLSAAKQLEKETVRNSILAGESRIDGRDTQTVRDIKIKNNLLPRAHGSSLFTRGETQALVVTTLGSDRDSQLIDALEGKRYETFMLHYNFPSYSVGEVSRRFGGPGRREIGHGKLAKRALEAVMPSFEQFPYTIRVVSEITESNGSSSMATVCGASLSMMEAGVPLSAPVAGVAMGLIKENDQYKVLTDILGDEDHLGDMDFKVAGTVNGITALQMDIKINGITKEIMTEALRQAKMARMHILGEMNQVIDRSKESVSKYAPHTISFEINPNKIRDVIGKGGAVIKALQEETNSTISIEDQGQVKIFSVDEASAQQAKSRIEEITADLIVGKVYKGKATKIVDFGVFITLPTGKDGLVHISQISEERVENINDYVEVGQAIDVRIIEIDRQGRIRLSMKTLEEQTS